MHKHGLQRHLTVQLKLYQFLGPGLELLTLIIQEIVENSSTYDQLIASNSDEGLLLSK